MVGGKGGMIKGDRSKKCHLRQKVTILLLGEHIMGSFVTSNLALQSEANFSKKGVISFFEDFSDENILWLPR